MKRAVYTDFQVYLHKNMMCSKMKTKMLINVMDLEVNVADLARLSPRVAWSRNV